MKDSLWKSLTLIFATLLVLSIGLLLWRWNLPSKEIVNASTSTSNINQSAINTNENTNAEAPSATTINDNTNNYTIEEGQVKNLNISLKQVMVGEDHNIRAFEATTDEIDNPSSCIWYGSTGVSGYTMSTDAGLESTPPWRHTITLACPDQPSPGASDTGFATMSAYCRTNTDYEYRVMEKVVKWDDPLCVSK